MTLEPTGKLEPSYAVRWALLATVIAVLWRLLMGWMTPVVQDEAYYLMWARHLDFGYFDHPPLVAWLAAAINWAPGSTLAGRMGPVILSIFYSLICARLLWCMGVQTRRGFLAGLILSNGSLLLIFGAQLVTPDNAMLPFWAWGLLEAHLALQGNKKRWLLAGVATGLGLLGKYTMAIIGPVYLWGLLRSRPDQLRTPWPYLGGVLAFAIFSLNIVWNAQNDNIAFKFQMRHGFDLERPASVGALPEPLSPDAEGPEQAWAAVFADLVEATEEEERAEPVWAPVTKSLNRYFGYYATQVGFWGLLLVPMVQWFRRRRQTPPLPASPLLHASIVFPLIVFGSISLLGKAEANWSAMYLIGAAIWFAPRLEHHLKWLTRGLLINAGLILLIISHAKFHWVPAPAHKDRILKETYGYDQLADVLVHLDAPVFSDTYQIASMVTHARPGLTVMQWPGITRYSEYTRRPELTPVTFKELLQRGKFYLVTTDQIPPRIRGFAPRDMQQIRNCKDESIQVINRVLAQEVEGRCRHPIHEWYLITYESF